MLIWSSNPTASSSHIITMLSKVVTIGLLSAAGCTALSSNEIPPYSWAIHNFNGICWTKTCRAWDFSISGSTGQLGQPAFEAYDCGPDSRIDEHQHCEGMEMNVPGSVTVQIEDVTYQLHVLRQPIGYVLRRSRSAHVSSPYRLHHRAACGLCCWIVRPNDTTLYWSEGRVIFDAYFLASCLGR
ncbi:hypothetical protein C7974DRAFT_102169 [Boeremia exigua]|uniref:uncharacterized protein n=1 Tax=Boeremia exigua TaxID=749465 RepID=UPI001E8E87AF|nr:uncharacterized protein C7974DRAFT_102169 [Boeremia exigua]KAH6642429.1 hypothetical protein C7974DRAFT_102169 [Boeremia exigua]